MNPVDPVLCQTLLLTNQERDLLEVVAERWGCTAGEAARSMVLTGILKEEIREGAEGE